MPAFQRRLLVAALIAGAAVVPASGCAQGIRASQLGTVSQMVGTTRIEVVYRRPVARGRTLFGSLVPWGRVWSPSADTAALFTASTPIRVNGEALNAGTYSLFAIPNEGGWTIIFSAAHPLFHMNYPDGRDALRVNATPRTRDHLETLAFYFPMVDADSAELVLHWGKTVVPLAIRSHP
jgi:hypothetical protein